MATIDYIKLAKELTRRGKHDANALNEAFEVIREIERTGIAYLTTDKKHKPKPIYDEENFRVAHELVKDVRSSAQALVHKSNGSLALDLYWRCRLFDAPYDFDSFCLYLEKNREVRKQFYLPRRKQLLPIVQSLNDLADGKLDLLTVSCPPGVGKTTVAEFFLCYLEGRNPELSVLGGSHSNSFLRGLYEEILRVVDKDGEYTYNEIFPDAPLVKTNALDMRIDLGSAKRFQSFQFSSIGSGNAGKVRASNLLYCDDLVDGIETALSADRMDKLWQQYYTDLRQRKIGNCAELHIATRWSVRDIIGRLEQQYEDDPRARFLKYAALDENDESNFDYPYNLGFTTEFYHAQRDIMDDASWKALYMNDPIETRNRLFDDEELKRYFAMPDREPDSIIAVCDIADGGGDYWAMPIAYQFGNEYYIEDFVCDDGKPDIVEEKIVQKLAQHNVQMARFETNRGGTRVAEGVQKRLKELGARTKITTKYNTTNKETRIIMASGYAKDRFIFHDESYYKEHKEYKRAMDFLTSYTMAGKNKHDDVPDAISMLVDYISTFQVAKAEVMQRFF